MAETRECGDEAVDAGRGSGQRGWYEWAAQHVIGPRVIDVGCGLGYGLDILRSGAPDVFGQDLDPRLARPSVLIGPLSTVPTGFAETVVSIDVIEHVPDDAGFLRELARIATRRILLSTPNWTAGVGSGLPPWPYHVREYTPRQLRELCETVGTVQMWKGHPDGFVRYPIRRTAWNDRFNAGRSHRYTGQIARVVNGIVPDAARIHSHLAVTIDI